MLKRSLPFEVLLALILGQVASEASLQLMGIALRGDIRAFAWLFPFVQLVLTSLLMWLLMTFRYGDLLDRKGRDGFGGFTLGSGSAALGVLAGLGAFGVNVLLSAVVGGEQSGTTSSVLATQHRLISEHPVLYTMCAVAVAPFGEELTFRGALQYWASRYASNGVSIVAVALGFSILHQVGDIDAHSVLQLTVAGIWFGIVRVATGKLLPAVIAHSTYNLIPVASQLVT